MKRHQFVAIQERKVHCKVKVERASRQGIFNSPIQWHNTVQVYVGLLSVSPFLPCSFFLFSGFWSHINHSGEFVCHWISSIHVLSKTVFNSNLPSLWKQELCWRVETHTNDVCLCCRVSLCIRLNVCTCNLYGLRILYEKSAIAHFSNFSILWLNAVLHWAAIWQLLGKNQHKCIYIISFYNRNEVSQELLFVFSLSVLYFQN